MKKLLLILLTCFPVLAQTSIAPLTLRLTDFPQSSPIDTVQIFSRNYAATDGLAGLVWRMENSGFAGLFPTSDSFARLSIGHIQPITALDIRGTPVSNFDLFWMNDQHTWTGSSGTGPGMTAAVGQSAVFTARMLDTILADNSYNVDVGPLDGTINTFQHKNLRLNSVASDGTVQRMLILSHAGFIGITDGVTSGGTGIVQFTDSDGLFQGDTNAMGQGGTITLTPAPTKQLVISGGQRVLRAARAGTYQILIGDYYIFSSATSTKTLTDASDVGAGKVIVIKSGAGAVTTVNPAGADTIDGLGTDSILALGTMTYISDGGTNWEKN